MWKTKSWKLHRYGRTRFYFTTAHEGNKLRVFTAFNDFYELTKDKFREYNNKCRMHELDWNKILHTAGDHGNDTNIIMIEIIRVHFSLFLFLFIVVDYDNYNLVMSIIERNRTLFVGCETLWRHCAIIYTRVRHVCVSYTRIHSVCASKARSLSRPDPP